MAQANEGMAEAWRHQGGGRQLRNGQWGRNDCCEGSRGRDRADSRVNAAQRRCGAHAERCSAVKDLCGCRSFLAYLSSVAASAPPSTASSLRPRRDTHAHAQVERVVIARFRVCACDAGCDSEQLGAQLPSRGQARGSQASRSSRASRGRATHQTQRGLSSRRPPRAPARPRAIAPGERPHSTFLFRKAIPPSCSIRIPDTS